MSFEYLTCPSCGHEVKRYHNPLPTADIIVSIEGRVLLIKRKNPPHGWAIPGGFIDYGESAEHAAHREIKEEAGIKVEGLTLFDVYSAPGRDPRFHTLTVVYTATSTQKPRAGDDAGEVGLFTLDTLPDTIAFDHRDILERYFALHCEG